MCWIGNLNIQYAEKDIPIFKIMRLCPHAKDIVISHYFSEIYELGKLKESDIIPVLNSWDFGCLVNTALHSYNPLKIEVKKRYYNI